MHSCRPPPPTTASDSSALTYTHKRFFVGLDQSGQVTKTPFGSKVVLDDGRTLSLSQLRALDAAGRQAKFGAMTPALHAGLANASEDKEVQVAFHFVPQLDPAWARSVYSQSATEAVRRQAKDTAAASLARQAAAFAAHLRARGVASVVPVAGLPLVQGVARVSLLRALARDPSVATISGAEAVPVQELAVPIHDPVPFTGADVAMWPAGVLGDAYAIGDVGVDALMLYDEHDVFKDGGVSYTAGAVTCSADADCVQYAPSRKCVAGTCRSVHQSQVASVVAQIAPHARIVHANEGQWTGTRWTVGGSLVALGRAYEAFRTYYVDGKTIPVVVEAYRDEDSYFGSQVDGLVQDEYARLYDVIVSKGAGNKYFSPVEEACPHTLNSLCVGSTNSGGGVSCFSSYVNPGKQWNWPSPLYPSLEMDREEPDLVAFGGDGRSSQQSGTYCEGIPDEHVRVLDMNSVSGFQGQVGTSFAAPAVGAMMSLAKQYCEAVQGSGIPGLWWRAAARNATWAHNPEEWQYSTLNGAFPGHPGQDHRDGGGLLRLEPLVAWCVPPSSGPGTLLTGGIINLRNPGGETPPGGGEFDPVPPGAQNHASQLRPLKQYVTDPGGDGQEYVRLETFQDLRGGDRVRITVTWNSCIVDNGVAPGRIGVDFDVFLWRMDGQSPGPIFGSQTLDDNNEGFDVTIPAGEEGAYAAFLAFPKDSAGCAGSNGEEPYAYHRVLWH